MGDDKEACTSRSSPTCQLSLLPHATLSPLARYFRPPCISCSPSWWAPAWPCPSGRAPTCTSPTRWPGCRCMRGTTAAVAMLGTPARRILSATWLARSFSRTRTLTETTLRDIMRSFRIQSPRTTETTRRDTTPRRRWRAHTTWSTKPETPWLVSTLHKVVREDSLGNLEMLLMCFYLPSEYQPEHSHPHKETKPNQQARHASISAPAPMEDSRV